MFQSEGPRLAIIIPTFRFDAIARQALSSAAAIGSADTRVHMGDNSENPEKHAFLQDLAKRSCNVEITCHPKNIGAEPNWLFLVRSQTTPLICMAADDDSFCGAYFTAGTEILSSDIGCEAASGLQLSVANDPRSDMPSLYSPPQRLEPDALTRVRRYNNQNAIAYAVTRTSTIRDFADYVEQNPLKGAFNDYLLAFHLLSIGTYRLDRNGYVYVYDNNAWYVPRSAFASSAKFYVGCGLPEGFAHLARLHWAVANAHFFRSHFRAPHLSNKDADLLAAYLFERLVLEFREVWRAEKSAVDALLSQASKARDALQTLAMTPQNDTKRIFELFAVIVAAFHPELAAKYQGFLERTLKPGLQPWPTAPWTERLKFWKRV